MNRDFTTEDMAALNPTQSRSIQSALHFVQNPVHMCDKIYKLIQDLNDLLKQKVGEQKLQGGSMWNCCWVITILNTLVLLYLYELLCLHICTFHDKT